MARLARTATAGACAHACCATRRRPRLVLGVLCLAQFLVVLDTSIVNVALPAIDRDLGFASQTELQHVISLYALTFGGLLIVAGRATDRFGRRRLFMAGLVGFTLSSIACGFARAPEVLLVARALQGVGSAVVSSAALALLTALFAEGPARNRALGAWGAVGGAAGACGMLLGGALTNLAGWPWIFFINAPLGLIALLSAPRLLPSERAEHSPSGLDLPGAFTITAGLGSLTFGLSHAEQNGITSAATLGALVAAGLLLAAFVMIERRVPHPLVTSRLVRTSGIVTANLAMLILTTIVASNLFFTTLYVQRVLGFTPWQTGLAFVPNSVLVVTGSAIATRLAPLLRPGGILAAGFTILIAGGLLLSRVAAGGSYATDVLPGFALTGLGLGLGFVAATLAATRGVIGADRGLASGVVNSAQQLGFAVGIAAVVTAALALTPTGTDSDVEHLAASYSTGYLLDSGLAAIGVIAALVLARAQRAA